LDNFVVDSTVVSLNLLQINWIHEYFKVKLLITFDLEWTSEWLLFDIKCSFFSYVVGIRHYFSMRWWCLLCI